MDLEKLNLVELNAQEMQEVEGGFLPLLIIGAALLLTGCATLKEPVYQGNLPKGSNDTIPKK